MNFSAYGLRIQSDIAIDGLPTDQSRCSSCLTIETVPFSHSDIVSMSAGSGYQQNFFQGRAVHTCPGDYQKEYIFYVEGVAYVRINRQERKIFCHIHPSCSHGVLSYWLLRYFVPFFVALEGRGMFFHGSAARIGVAAVGFIANSFGGKSTLVNYLNRRGNIMLTDDDLLVERNPSPNVVPAIPFVRANRTPEDLGLQVEGFDASSVKLSKVYVLEFSEHGSANVVPLATPAAFVELMRHNRFLFIDQAARRFHFCSELVRSIPVGRLIMPRALDRLEEVRQVILSDQGVMQ